ncbi:MAG: DUF2203 domain-containing protein [Candidatus Hydrogenedentota bacterium]
MPAKKIFTLTEARAQLPLVRELTQQCHDDVEAIREEMTAETNEARRAAMEEKAEARLQEWSRGIMEIGAEPKGLWLVDFDSGDGFYFCWQLGEDQIEYIHGYEAGYGGRRKISWT